MVIRCIKHQFLCFVALFAVLGTTGGSVGSLHAGAVGGPKHGRCDNFGKGLPRVQFKGGEVAAVAVVGEGYRVQILDEAGHVVAEDAPMVVGGLSRGQAVAIVAWTPAKTQFYTIKVGDNGTAAAGYKTN